jgi:hypothetical protein
MKFVRCATLTGLVLSLGAEGALAGGGAPVPAQPEGGPPSGRPGAILSEAQCKDVWSRTEREGDTLSADKAAPFVVNFKLLDVDGNGKITLNEFFDGCSKGLVQENASKPPTSGGGQTPENPTGK